MRKNGRKEEGKRREGEPLERDEMEDKEGEDKAKACRGFSPNFYPRRCFFRGTLQHVRRTPSSCLWFLDSRLKARVVCDL